MYKYKTIQVCTSMSEDKNVQVSPKTSMYKYNWRQVCTSIIEDKYVEL